MNIFQSRINSDIKNRINSFNKEKTEFNSCISILKTDKNRILNDTQLYKVKCFNFMGNIHSDYIKNYRFTNYLEDYHGSIYAEFKEVISKMINCDKSVLQDFTIVEYTPEEEQKITQKQKRLNSIIRNVNNINNDYDLNITEIKPSRSKKDENTNVYGMMRFFVELRQEGIIDVFLIDLYHLGIDVQIENTKERSVKHNFNKYKNAKNCISKIVDEIIFD